MELEKIKAKFSGTNFMTPDVLKYGESSDGEHIYELSKGIGMSKNKIFGVTVLTKEGESTDLSELWDSLDEAQGHIASL